MVADKSLLVGDEVTDLLAEYAALMSKVAGGDMVKVNALTPDGHPVVATFVLNSATVMAAESVGSAFTEPDNAAAQQYLRERLDSYTITPADLLSLGQPAAGDAAD